MVNAVTGRSFSTTVWADTGRTSTIQGEASSWRRNRVYAWMSTVRPFTSNWTACTTGALPALLLSVWDDVAGGTGVAGGGGGAPGPTRGAAPTGPRSTSQVYAGSARVTSSRRWGHT